MSLYVSLYYMSSSYFPGVSGVTVVTQKPPVVTVRKGETATMNCNLGTVDNNACLYKQVPGGVPQYMLSINNVEEADSAVYYCQTHDDSTLPPPVLTILPPSSDELKSSKVTLVCLASQMAMGYADVSWTAGGSPVTGDIATSGPVPQADKTFQLSSCLTVDTSEWNQDKVFSCKVTAGSKFAEKDIKKSECSTE
uniref:Ig-like domain-containing protein n=1 Tax=Hucho hucho TaxID=62062 RepID=A0A4W5K8X9_9TELE